MQNFLSGKKTYIGLAVALVGVLGLGQYISGPETTELLNHLFEAAGLIMAVYGRVVAKPKSPSS